MAGNVEPTPRVLFILDNSEIIRLSKLRAVLKLAHWGKIGGTYELQVDETVAKSIKSLETNDPVAYDKQYAPWLNRYTDFKLSWVKSKDPDTHEIMGHLMATGKPRIANLGKIGQGCRVSLMHGPILHEPLPTTKVGDLRINHLQMEIEFEKPLKLDGNQSESINFKVGHNNKLFGEELRVKNTKRFKEAQELKKGPVTQEFLTSLFKSLGNLSLDKKTSGGEDGDEISDIDNAEGDDTLKLGASPSLFNRNKKAYDSNNWSNSGPTHPSFHQSFRPTTEQNKVTDLVRNTVGSSNDDPNSSRAEGGQPLGGAASLDSHKVNPERSNAVDDQVRHEIPLGKQKFFCISVQTQLLNLLQSTLEKYRHLHLPFQSLLSPSHRLNNELLN